MHGNESATSIIGALQAQVRALEAVIEAKNETIASLNQALDKAREEAPQQAPATPNTKAVRPRNGAK